ncbi:MAG: hypothetical protein JNJ54_37035 [Myxococcaceae bacterium]|nr:hypothetical protein [Myxococcaceae bacterium]
MRAWDDCRHGALDVNALTSEPDSLAALPNGGAALAWSERSGVLVALHAWRRLVRAGWGLLAELVTPAPPALVPGVGGVDAGLLALTSTGAVVHYRLTGATWSAATTVGGSGLAALGAASAP